MIKRAAQVMTSKLTYVGWNQSMKEAFELMQEHRLRHLPVLDGESSIIGILSDRDVQRAMKSELRWEDEIRQKVPVFEKVEFDPDAKVRHYMSWPVKSVDRGADLRTVAGMMVTNKISSVLVTEGDRYVGIVTTEDMLKVMMGLLGDSQPMRLDLILGNALVQAFRVRPAYEP